MKNFNKLSHALTVAFYIATVALATLTACTKVDDTIGSNLIPDNQQMRAGYIILPEKGDLSPKKYVETRLFLTDSIISSNAVCGYMGSIYNDTLGSRTAGVMSQFVSYYRVDSGYFGYRPIFDSVQLKVAFESYDRDTTSQQEFEVYEIISNDYISKKPIAEGQTKADSAFYTGFTPESVPYLENKRIIGDKPLFTFKLGGENGPSIQAVTLTPTQEGLAYISRLMLQSGKYKGDYTIYEADNLGKWIEEFRGIYIKTKTDAKNLSGGTTRGGIYGTTIQSTGLQIFGRNRQKEDPTLIQDTIGLLLNFYDPYQTEHGNLSINTIRHDYSTATAQAKIDIENAREVKKGEVDLRPETTNIYVEGMGGVVTEITFGEEFFRALELLIEEENKKVDQTFRTLAFNQALMKVYFPSGRYDWQDLDLGLQGGLIHQMNGAPDRLGLYSNYKTITGVADYAYIYEKNYQLTLPYDGHINRSHGCYTMNITSYIQQVWNNYLDQKEAAGINRNASYSTIDWSKIKWKEIKKRSAYLAPEAYDLFTSSYTVLQGQAASPDGSIQNIAPIRFELAYNLIK